MRKSEGEKFDEKILNERIASEVETDYKDGKGGGVESLLLMDFSQFYFKGNK